MTNNIRKVREEQGISQLKLQNDLNISQQSISLYEKGFREPKLATWEKLSNYFHVSVPYLQGIEDSEEDKYIHGLWTLFSQNYELVTSSIYTYSKATSVDISDIEKMEETGEWTSEPISSFIALLSPILNDIIQTSKKLVTVKLTNWEDIENWEFHDSKNESTENISIALYSVVDNDVNKDIWKDIQKFLEDIDPIAANEPNGVITDIADFSSYYLKDYLKKYYKNEATKEDKTFLLDRLNREEETLKKIKNEINKLS